MKAFITALVLLVATGAFAQKGNPTTISDAQHSMTSVKGIVSRFEGKACDFYITATINGQPVKYLPLNLPAEFVVDGRKIVFDFVSTSDKVDESCVVSAINVSNVKLQKLK